MLKGFCEDINAVIDWELAHGNAISNIPPRLFDGDLIVLMLRPLRMAREENDESIPSSLRSWEFRDPHYGEDQWLSGFESTETGQVIFGPLK